MKDSKIVADLAGYLHKILPSTPCEPGEIQGRHGIRVQLVAPQWFDVMLNGSYWEPARLQGSVPVGHRRPVATTYPELTLHVAHLVAFTLARPAASPMMIPLDRPMEALVLAAKAALGNRVREATEYIEQVAADPSTPWSAMRQSRRSLTVIRARIAELGDHRRNPGPGAPTPAEAPSG